MRKLFVLFVLIFLGTISFAQDFSNKGKEFWIPYSYHVGMVPYTPNNPVVMTLYLTSDITTTYDIEIFGGSSIQSGTINAGQVLTSIVPISAFIDNEGKFINKAVHVTAKNPIVVYSYITQSAISGATLCLPTNVLGREYVSMNYRQVSNSPNSNSYFTIIAVEDNTQVEITPSANTKSGWVAGTTYPVTLQKGEIYQVLGANNNNAQGGLYYGNDLTGSTIKSVATSTSPCKKIAVFSGAGKIRIGASCGSNTSSDNLYQQLYPLTTWGKVFLTVPSFSKPLNYYRIIRSKSSSIVKLNGTVIPSASFANGYYEFSGTVPYKIESDEPISVSQYFTTQGCDGNSSPLDPDMIILNPTEQNLSKVTLVSSNLVATANRQHHLQIIMPNSGTGISSFKLDGNPVPISSWVTHPENPSYSYLYLSNVTQGYHTLNSDSGFNALAYGYAAAESYGYSAGSSVKDLYQTLTTNNKYATVKLPATCKGTPFKISITLPYIPVSLEWKVPNYPAIPKDNNPTLDSTSLVAGKKVYHYSLPGTFNYASVGTYNIQVIANNPTTDGCSGEQQIDFDLQVFEPPKGGFKFTTTNCGKYTIKYFAYTDVGCLTDTIVQDIYLDSVPIADFSILGTTCQNKDITFVDASRVRGGASIKEWLWLTNTAFTNTTNANVVEKFTALQQYTVQLRVKTQNGCLSPAKSLTFSNNPNPVVDFSLPKICLPDGMGTFNDQTTIPDGSQASFIRNWYFGDPNATSTNIDTALNRISPSHKYTAVGPYNIKLIIRTNNGCVDSLSKQLTEVFAQPKADFTVTPEVCLRENTKMNDLTNPQGRTMVKWNWTLSNGLKDNLQNPSFILVAAGTYTAKLVGFTADGCISDTATKSFIVHPLPLADFKVIAPACETETVSFEQLSTANVGSLTRWNWRLGNAAIPQDFTNASLVTKTFATWGDQVIKLMVENSKGCKSDTVTKTIRIHPKPFVNNSIPEVCLSDAFAEFSDSSKIADNSTGFAHLWKFGDANAIPSNPDSSILKNTRHKYTAAGTYTVSHMVTSLAGCVSTKSISFIVSGAVPKANFVVLLPDSLCSNDTVRIKNLSTVDFGFIGKLEIFWDYDNNPSIKDVDQVPDSGKIYKHVYPKFSNQPLKPVRIIVRAFSGGSCSDDENSQVNLLGSPAVQFDSIPGICLDATPRQISQIKYTDVTGIASGDSLFTGKGVSAKGLYTPLNAGVGTYVLQYTFTASNGCRDTASKSIIVWPRPTADFVFSTLNCEKNPITFTSKAVPNTGNLVKWNWNFGDGSPIQSIGNANPLNYTYSLFKSYNVSLDVVTNNGCTSEPKILPVIVYPLPVMNFDLPKVCLPEGKALFTNNTTIPDGTGSLITYLWDFGDPNNTNPAVTKDGTHNYLSLGSYNVKLVATSNNNCKDSLSRQLVDVFPQPKAFYSSLDSACLGKDIQFTDTSNGFVRPITAWNWDFGNGNIDKTKNPLYTYRATGTFNVSLFVVSSEGCVSDTAVKSITIHPYPRISAGPDMYVLDDGQKTILATATGNSLTYSWSPATYLNFTNILQPMVVKPQDDIVYTLSVTGRGNCTSTDDIAITVLKMPKPPNTFTPNGDGINDLWNIKYLDQYPGCIIEVYSPQGQLLFRSEGYAKPWDGTYKGNTMPTGTYYYVIDPKSGRKKIAGYVTIFK